MERILIIGSSGAGKSTLACALGRRLNMPAIHLDQLYWQPGWRKSDSVAFLARVAEVLAAPRWVMDGTYATTLPERLVRADTVLWLDYGRAICFCRVAKRIVSHWGRTRPDMADGCPERLDLEFLAYIWSFRRRQVPRLTAALAQHGRHAHLHVLKTPSDTVRFLASLDQN
ncbi:MAG: topology modulation protein [Ancalomicrobiaceae bacterium]|nr:topology modulation protein [Ancalomicrobiaceae bacterium]